MHACIMHVYMCVYICIMQAFIYLLRSYIYIYICKYISTVQKNFLPQLAFLIIEAIVFSETPVQTSQSAPSLIPEDCYFIPIFCITNMDHWF